jgi:diketogulonate reductase-like aldo/keto reductase
MPYGDALSCLSDPALSSTHAVWRAFEGLVESGKVRQLGISNIYDLRALQDIYHDADVKPAVVQNR